MAVAEIVKTHPHIQGINFDPLHVVDTAPKYPGVSHVGGDMFASKADVLFLEVITELKLTLLPLAPGAGVIGGGRGYGRLGVNPNAMILWDRNVFLQPTQGISENANFQSRAASHSMGTHSTATSFPSTNMVSEQDGVVFSEESNGRLRNQAGPAYGDRHVHFDNSQLQDEVVDGVVQGPISEMHGDGSISVTGRVLRNQGDGISAAIAMVNAGNRVSVGIRRRVDDPQRKVATAGTEHSLIGGVDPLLHVGTMQFRGWYDFFL
ncbi:hypothetical protein NE237_000915 [Protea cynaroides]|uniref:O-methyltransferase C-terminal domain-containing protein n=1 Tax=Protea cynaroides TaxID=273540 RepID=A0A9Q0QXY5_9MAGN|nr:hypothetical protein NE237_000915 [Protea cynaroides]